MITRFMTSESPSTKPVTMSRISADPFLLTLHRAWQAVEKIFSGFVDIVKDFVDFDRLREFVRLSVLLQRERTSGITDLRFGVFSYCDSDGCANGCCLPSPRVNSEMVYPFKRKNGDNHLLPFDHDIETLYHTGRKQF